MKRKPQYTTLFFDLDDTLWAFSENAKEASEETFYALGLAQYFDSFIQYFSLFEERNTLYWEQYASGKLSRQELNDLRFSYPLEQVGVQQLALARQFCSAYFAVLPYKKNLMPNTLEVLEYLRPTYKLGIISNGFKDMQGIKMQSAGIDTYFDALILSDDVGCMKPEAAIFEAALQAMKCTATEALMIGDNVQADIAGAAGVGIDQVFYRVNGSATAPVQASYTITDLAELLSIL